MSRSQPTDDLSGAVFICDDPGTEWPIAFVTCPGPLSGSTVARLRAAWTAYQDSGGSQLVLEQGLTAWVRPRSWRQWPDAEFYAA